MLLAILSLAPLWEEAREQALNRIGKRVEPSCLTEVKKLVASVGVDFRSAGDQAVSPGTFQSEQAFLWHRQPLAIQTAF